MRIFRDPKAARLSDGSVVTIGNFDGVHRGHQALIERCRERAGEHSGQQSGAELEVAVVTFEPLPRFWFDRQSAPPRLTGPAHKLALLASHGVDLAWAMRFNGALASMPAPEFVRRVLVEGLAARHLVLGGDFRFGRRREGGLDLLEDLGRVHGYTVEMLPSVEDGGKRISSTRVRAALAEGRFEDASRLLGRPFSLCGRVVAGQRLGRSLGYPTANLRRPDGKCPVAGVFAVRARVHGRGPDEPGSGTWRDGVANLGVRPAVGGGEPLLEVHLFDFDGDLYGRRLETHFVAKLRDEAHFETLDALKSQMCQDEARAREWLASNPMTGAAPDNND